MTSKREKKTTNKLCVRFPAGTPSPNSSHHCAGPSSASPSHQAGRRFIARGSLPLVGTGVVRTPRNRYARMIHPAIAPTGAQVHSQGLVFPGRAAPEELRGSDVRDWLRDKRGGNIKPGDAPEAPSVQARKQR